MPNYNDLELISKFKAGDSSVFNLLVQRWYATILSFLYRISGNMDDVQDTCQKTFVTVYCKLHQLKETDKFSTWLYRIANNHATDFLRDRKRQIHNHRNKESGEDEFALDTPDPEPPDFETKIDGAQLRHLFEKIMQAIPDEQRTVIIMKIYQDLKFSEIAQVLDIAINTVKSRMYYGLRTLKEALSKNRLIEEILKNEM